MDVDPDFAIFFHQDYFQLWSLDTAIRARGKYIYISQPLHTDKKENKIFLIYKEIKKEYMRKGFLIFEKMSKYLVICEENNIFFIISVCTKKNYNIIIVIIILCTRPFLA